MTRERLTGIGVLVLGLLVFFVLIPRGVDQPGNVEHAALAPDFWPRIIAVVIALMGLLLAIKPAREDDGEKGVGEGGEGNGAGESSGAGEGSGGGEAVVRWPQRLPGLAVTLGALFVFYFLIPFLGMVASGAALIFGLMVYAGERRWPRGAAIAVGVPVALYLFFVYVASIPIPLGVFESLRG